MKRVNQVIWGIILVAIGLVVGMNALGIADIDIFFEGWWTLFIIIPSVIGLFCNHDKIGNLIGLCIGVLLLLCCRDILDFTMFWKLLFPVIIVLIGVKMIFGSFFDRKTEKIINDIKVGDGECRCGTAVFSGEDLNFAGEEFHGAELNAVFGGVKCDLRNAIINQDCVIDVSAIFGGIDIYVPANINVKVGTTSLFGGVTNKVDNYHNPSVPTIYIKGTCMFGGVDIK